MMTLDEIREKLRDRRLAMVADAIGVHRQTIYNVMDVNSDPKHSTVKALSDYLQGADA